MDIKNLVRNAKQLTSCEFEKKLNKLVRDNYHYRNLDRRNRKIILDLIKKWKEKIRRGTGISDSAFRTEMHRLYKDRIKLGLSEEDLKDIKEIMDAFRRG